MFSAGEASGDKHAAAVFRAMRERIPHLHAIGMGGAAMREAGIELIVDSSGLGVVGLGEVLRHYGDLRRALTTMQKTACKQRPDLLICVDYKEFNLKLARHAKACGIKVLFYVSPQVWAWRPGRVKTYGAAIDMMAVIFPFETAFYEAENIPVSYVGHPLAGRVQASAPREVLMAEFGLAPDQPVVGLLPGSRKAEIERLLPIMLQAAALIAAQHPAVQFILPRASSIANDLLEPHLAAAKVRVTVIPERSYDVLACCDAVMVASGTATLEVALMQVPMAILYKVNPLTYAMLKPLIRIPDIGLANIVAGRRIVPEFVQGAAKPETLAAEIQRILEDADYAERMRKDLAEVKEKLGPGGGVERMADLACGMLAKI
ncbi:MAG: lipid-A-disaccharide synthase [Gammaproteobacteria bacterium]|nr:lipid-A-disaccharide synthase [Gammaproteobacteria bacterium]